MSYVFPSSKQKSLNLTPTPTRPKKVPGSQGSITGSPQRKRPSAAEQEQLKKQIKVRGVYMASVGRAPVVYPGHKLRKAESAIECSQLYITSRTTLEERPFSHHCSVRENVALHANGAFL